MSTCKCGKTLISKTTDLLINGSSQPIALNIASLVGTPKDILLESGQVFSTVTNKLNYQIGGGVGNTVIINTKLVIDHQIKVVIKTESGRVLGVKYVGSFNKQTIVDSIQFSSSDLIPYLTNDERLIIQFHSMCDFSTSDCCDKLPDFTITNILNTFCVRLTTTTTTSTTLPPTYCFDSWPYSNLVTTISMGTIYGSSSFTTWTAGPGYENIYLLKQDNFAYFYRLISSTSGFIVGESITLNNTPPGFDGTYILIEKIPTEMYTPLGTVTVMWHKLACVTDTTTTGTTTTGTTTTGTTTTGTTTTGTTTTGTTTTGTTTTGTTTTCAPWPEFPCIDSALNCAFIEYIVVDGVQLDLSEYEQYIFENPCYNGEEIYTVTSNCSTLNCTWRSSYTGNAPPSWELINDPCTSYNNDCTGNCGGCQYPEELPPLEDGVDVYTECDCVG